MPKRPKQTAQPQETSMSSFDHIRLIQDVNESLTRFRKTQTETLAGFGQLSRAVMTEGVLSTKS